MLCRRTRPSLFTLSPDLQASIQVHKGESASLLDKKQSSISQPSRVQTVNPTQKKLATRAKMSLQAMLKSSHSVAARSRLAPASLRSRATTVRALASAAPKPVHIVGISGSLRKASTNTGLLRAAQKHLPPGVTMEIADLHDLPTYNDDLWQGGTDESVLPPAIGKFRQTVLRGDALLFATPEYNLSITSALKAAIDWGWCSRGPNVFDGKAAAIMGSGGSGGTVRAQVALRQCAVNLNVHFLNGPEILLRRYENPHYFNENGDVVDPKIDGYIKNMVHALVEYSRKLKS